MKYAPVLLFLLFTLFMLIELISYEYRTIVEVVILAILIMWLGTIDTENIK